MKTTPLWPWFLVVCAAFFAACAGPSQRALFRLDRFGRVERKTLDLLLWENPLKPEQNISSTLILSGEYFSSHLVQIRGAEAPHSHRFHDMAVQVEKGSGTLYCGKEKVFLKPGAMVFVPRNTPHYFVNQGSEPAVAVVLFAPPYDGTDNEPVKEAPQETR